MAPIDWKLLLERKLFAARFDEAKMQQALMKIVENAVEAFTGFGRITLRTRNVELADRSQDLNVKLAAGPYASEWSGLAQRAVPSPFNWRPRRPAFDSWHSQTEPCLTANARCERQV